MRERTPMDEEVEALRVLRDRAELLLDAISDIRLEHHDVIEAVEFLQAPAHDVSVGLSALIETLHEGERRIPMLRRWKVQIGEVAS